jgi:hypothetical protein
MQSQTYSEEGITGDIVVTSNILSIYSDNFKNNISIILVCMSIYKLRWEEAEFIIENLRFR